MLAKSVSPRRAAPRWPIWPIPVAIICLIAVVLGVLFLPRMWAESLTSADGSQTPGASPDGAATGATTACADAKTKVAVAGDYAAAGAAAADAFNKSKGSCVVTAVPYTNSEQLTELASGDRAQLAVLGSDSATTLADALGAELVDQGTVAQTQGVIAVPEPLVGPLGWTSSPSWEEIGRTLPNPQRWTASANADLGPFNVALADMTTSTITQGFGLGMAAAALGKAPQDVAPEELASPQAQGVLLGLVNQASIRTASQTELLERIKAADAAGNLPTVVSAAVMDEHTVVAYNSAEPKVKLTAFYPSDSAVTAAINYQTSADASDQVKEFGEFLAGADGQAALMSVGLRATDGATKEGFAEQLNAVGEPASTAMPLDEMTSTALAAGWQRLTHPGRFLVLMDVSGSMAETVPGTGRTRLQFAQEAAVTGMRLVPPDAQIGVWEFSTLIDADLDYRELVPVGPVKDSMGGQTRLDYLVSAINALVPLTDTGMYDTALAGFREMQETYSPGQPNVVVLITDGHNDDPNSISLDNLVATLQEEQDPEKPVRFLTLAYGESADADSLAKIAEATGGSAYVSPNPADIGAVFFQALMNG